MMRRMTDVVRGHCMEWKWVNFKASVDNRARGAVVSDLLLQAGENGEQAVTQLQCSSCLALI
jgi:hypothetical protein